MVKGDLGKIPPAKLFPSINPSSIRAVEFLEKGGHSTVFRVELTCHDGSTVPAIMKAFSNEFTEELRSEIAAYKIFYRENVGDFVPRLYAYKEWTQREWRKNFPSIRLERESGEEVRGGITTFFLEYIADAEFVSPENVSTMIAAKALVALESIHKLGILHGDIKIDNLLIVPSTGRVVWIDFSSSVTPVTRLQNWLDLEMQGVLKLVHYDCVSTYSIPDG